MELQDNRNDRRCRAWCFTFNNYTPGDYDTVETFMEECRYAVVGKEGSANGTPHLQGYCYFRNAKRFSTVKAKLARAHWEPAIGTPIQNRTYCSKEGNYKEWGTIPTRGPTGCGGNNGGDDEKDRWDMAKQLAIAGSLDEVPGDIYIRCYNSLKTIKKDHMGRPDRLREVCGVWIYGEAGFGKSHRAREMTDDEAYMKMCNKWWDGYQHENNVIIDDWELDMGKTLGHHLKIWSQNQSFIAEAKGSALHIRPKRIIVTSNYSIEEVFAHDQTLVTAINRRFQTHWLNQPIDFDVPGAIQQAGLPEPEPVSVIVATEEPEAVVVTDNDSIPDIDLSIWDDDLTGVEI